MGNYDAGAKNRVLIRKGRFGKLRCHEVIHEAEKLGNSALVRGRKGGYFCIVSCLKIRLPNIPTEPTDTNIQENHRLNFKLPGRV